MTLTESYWPATAGADVRHTTVGDMVREAADAAPDVKALVDGTRIDGRSWTYSELLNVSEQGARALLGRFAPGDRIAVWGQNAPEWVLVELAAGFAGLTIVTVNPGLQIEEVRHILTRSGARAAFAVTEFRDLRPLETARRLVDEIDGFDDALDLADWLDFVATGSPDTVLPHVDPRSPAQIQFTSGSTGLPKGALLHHEGICNIGRLTMMASELPVGGTWINPMPLFHTAGCVVGVLGPIAMRGTHVLTQFEPQLVLELLEREQAFGLTAVPTMLLKMIEHPDFAKRDVSSLTAVLTGAAAVPAYLIAQIEEAMDCKVANCYGMTEVSAVTTMTRLDDSAEQKSVSVGTPLPGLDVKVMSPLTKEVVPVGSEGELCSRGFSIMLGYIGDEEGTAAAIDADGFLHSGDLAVMDERGYIRISGRLKDMIIRGGENVYPQEIENYLVQHPAITQACVIGRPHDVHGEEAVAVITALEGEHLPDPQDLNEYVRSGLARHKWPADWFTLPAFPVTENGKIRKLEVKKLLENGALDLVEPGS